MKKLVTLWLAVVLGLSTVTTAHAENLQETSDDVSTTTEVLEETAVDQNTPNETANTPELTTDNENQETQVKQPEESVPEQKQQEEEAKEPQETKQEEVVEKKEQAEEQKPSEEQTPAQNEEETTNPAPSTEDSEDQQKFEELKTKIKDKMDFYVEDAMNLPSAAAKVKEYKSYKGVQDHIKEYKQKIDEFEYIEDYKKQMWAIYSEGKKKTKEVVKIESELHYELQCAKSRVEGSLLNGDDERDLPMWEYRYDHFDEYEEVRKAVQEGKDQLDQIRDINDVLATEQAIHTKILGILNKIVNEALASGDVDKVLNEMERLEPLVKNKQEVTEEEASTLRAKYEKLNDTQKLLCCGFVLNGDGRIGRIEDYAMKRVEIPKFDSLINEYEYFKDFKYSKIMPANTIDTKVRMAKEELERVYKLTLEETRQAIQNKSIELAKNINELIDQVAHDKLMELIETDYPKNKYQKQASEYEAAMENINKAIATVKNPRAVVEFDYATYFSDVKSDVDLDEIKKFEELKTKIIGRIDSYVETATNLPPASSKVQEYKTYKCVQDLIKEYKEKINEFEYNPNYYKEMWAIYWEGIDKTKQAIETQSELNKQIRRAKNRIEGSLRNGYEEHGLEQWDRNYDHFKDYEEVKKAVQEGKDELDQVTDVKDIPETERKIHTKLLGILNKIVNDALASGEVDQVVAELERLEPIIENNQEVTEAEASALRTAFDQLNDTQKLLCNGSFLNGEGRVYDVEIYAMKYIILTNFESKINEYEYFKDIPFEKDIPTITTENKVNSAKRDIQRMYKSPLDVAKKEIEAKADELAAEINGLIDTLAHEMLMERIETEYPKENYKESESKYNNALKKLNRALKHETNPKNIAEFDLSEFFGTLTTDLDKAKQAFESRKNYLPNNTIKFNEESQTVFEKKAEELKNEAEKANTIEAWKKASEEVYKANRSRLALLRHGKVHKLNGGMKETVTVDENGIVTKVTYRGKDAVEFDRENADLMGYPIDPYYLDQIEEVVKKNKAYLDSCVGLKENTTNEVKNGEQTLFVITNNTGNVVEVIDDQNNKVHYAQEAKIMYLNESPLFDEVADEIRQCIERQLREFETEYRIYDVVRDINVEVTFNIVNSKTRASTTYTKTYAAYDGENITYATIKPLVLLGYRFANVNYKNSKENGYAKTLLIATKDHNKIDHVEIERTSDEMSSDLHVGFLYVEDGKNHILSGPTIQLPMKTEVFVSDVKQYVPVGYVVSDPDDKHIGYAGKTPMNLDYVRVVKKESIEQVLKEEKDKAKVEVINVNDYEQYAKDPSVVEVVQALMNDIDEARTPSQVTQLLRRKSQIEKAIEKAKEADNNKPNVKPDKPDKPDVKPDKPDKPNVKPDKPNKPAVVDGVKKPSSTSRVTYKQTQTTPKGAVWNELTGQFDAKPGYKWNDSKKIFEPIKSSTNGRSIVPRTGDEGLGKFIGLLATSILVIVGIGYVMLKSKVQKQ